MKATMRKLKNNQVDKLKGHLLEVRKIGSKPIFIGVSKSDTIGAALKNADVPTGSDTKLEAVREGKTSWEAVTLKDRAIKYSRVAVTTKVSGA